MATSKELRDQLRIALDYGYELLDIREVADVAWELLDALELEEANSYAYAGNNTKCPECTKLELKSKVYIGIGMVTCMYYPPYYDEEGRLHNHDYNINTINYTCSNGHAWSEERLNSCWCGWKQE